MSGDKGEPGKLFQVSILQAVASGYYPGFYPVRELKRHGDFGMGVFDRGTAR